MDAHVAAWLSRDPDPDTRAELERLIAAGDQRALGAAFAGRLEFGTAGLRGVIGAGPSRMNRLVVRETSAGLAAYLLATLGEDATRRPVIIGHDARTKSRLFAEDAAAVIAGLGVPVRLMDREAPTPLCAFAVGIFGAAAGVVVTASHNPPEYNGYKVFWGNGAQIIPPHDAGIAAAILEAAAAPPPACDLPAMRAAGRVTTLEVAALSDLYGAALEAFLHDPRPRRLVVAYTPLHGVGAELAESILRQRGFSKVHSVASQRAPDAAFPTVRFPNPEEPGAMDAVLARAREVSADLACANDPDADRLAVAARDARGEYVMLSGNEVGVLLGWAMLQSGGAGKIVATTIVSSRMLGVMARELGARYVETLTGFKWITNTALEAETTAPRSRFVFGYEEALGYSVHGLVRDKDGVSALACFCELADDAKQRGETVLDVLAGLYRRFGLFVTTQRTLALTPERLGTTALLRRRAPSRVAGRAVIASEDLLARERRLADGRREPLSLPESDVLVYHLEGDARVIVRPSGTEPKLKCYYELREPVTRDEPLQEARARAEAALAKLAETHQAELAM